MNTRNTASAQGAKKQRGGGHLKTLQQQVDEWNKTNPIGTPVIRYKLINPLREPTKTKTRSEAWVMGGHSVMVKIEGVSGGVVLGSVKLQKEEVSK